MSIDISSKNAARLRATALRKQLPGCRHSLLKRHAPRLNEGSYGQSGARWLMGKRFLRDSSHSLMSWSVNGEPDEPLCSDGRSPTRSNADSRLFNIIAIVHGKRDLEQLVKER
jgi:hypothetical protein